MPAQHFWYKIRNSKLFKFKFIHYHSQHQTFDRRVIAREWLFNAHKIKIQYCFYQRMQQWWPCLQFRSVRERFPGVPKQSLHPHETLPSCLTWTCSLTILSEFSLAILSGLMNSFWIFIALKFYFKSAVNSEIQILCRWRLPNLIQITPILITIFGLWYVENLPTMHHHPR